MQQQKSIDLPVQIKGKGLEARPVPSQGAGTKRIPNFGVLPTYVKPFDVQQFNWAW